MVRFRTPAAAVRPGDEVNAAHANPPSDDLTLVVSLSYGLVIETAPRATADSTQSKCARKSGWVVRVAMLQTTWRSIGRLTLTVPFSKKWTREAPTNEAAA